MIARGRHPSLPTGNAGRRSGRIIDRIVAALARRPMLAGELARAVGVKPVALRTIARKYPEAVAIEPCLGPRGSVYRLIGEPRTSPLGRSDRAALALIRERGTVTTPELAAHLGISTPGAWLVIQRLRGVEVEKVKRGKLPILLVRPKVMSQSRDSVGAHDSGVGRRRNPFEVM